MSKVSILPFAVAFILLTVLAPSSLKTSAAQERDRGLKIKVGAD